jgi:hypothetical protein
MRTTQKVKEHLSRRLSRLLLSNHRVVLPWCIHAMAFMEIPMDNFISQGFNVSLAGHRFVIS